MRLHEFTNRYDYILADTEVADFPKLLENVWHGDMADDAKPRSKHMQQTKQPAPPNTVSI